ncbi:MAG: hypothetical protein OXE17_01835 [Chloroflexi bacterium]|nr:hypothetical protein [Chloroflexota bacterium]
MVSPVVGHYDHQEGEDGEEGGADRQDAATSHALVTTNFLDQPDHSHDHQD